LGETIEVVEVVEVVEVGLSTVIVEEEAGDIFFFL